LTFHPQTFLTDVAARLAPHCSQESDGGRFAPSGRCPACQVLAESEEMLVQTLLATLPQPAFREAYMASAGVCLPHLRQALGQVEDEPTFTVLRDVAIAGEERLLAQLRDIIRKHDYRFRGEPVGAERGAAERAVHHVIGAPGIPG
jgi:hypothetical protein